ncbi:MAG: hypothetical protein KDD01_10565 [Phaeodactylibacter sp.]|nr:hypothetical protein [Phaeodactylibacter sp.]MCB0611998.1 hypothetical protein [Phaeodactylibacter sp.]MCB9304595.1 hypothetical protein [Lewinellaceae bacterium]
MTKHLTISKQAPPHKSMDYKQLRAEGIKHIEKLGSRIWTDYNIHDPGITILEALCYAITDLGYRANLPMADLMVFPPGSQQGKAFFSAAEVLTNRPVTHNDFRKILIDVEGVKNAWLLKAEGIEPPLFLETDADNTRLSFNTTDEPLILRGIYDVLLELEDNIDLNDLSDVAAIKQRVWEKLQANRNLCEDFRDIRLVCEKPVGICAHIEAQSTADIEWLQAKIYYAIGQYFSPGVPFYSLEEMLDKITVFKLTEASFTALAEAQAPAAVTEPLKAIQEQAFTGKAAFLAAIRGLIDPEPALAYESLFLKYAHKTQSADLLFNGPLLEHGFIDEAELEASQLRSLVFKSDILQILLDIEEVKAVNELMIGLCDENGQLDLSEEHWYLPLAADDKPVLDCSRLYYRQGNQEPFADPERAREKLAQLKALNQRPPLQGPFGLPIPKGKYRDFKDYTSLQTEFPDTYCIGFEGLPENATAERRAQARQLKGYLMFYDQILANYLATLDEVKKLFSVSPDEMEQTAFYQALYEIPGVRDLLFDYSGETDAAWEAFKTDPDNQYLRNLRRIVESDTHRLFRREALLDHLLARFGEQFTDFVVRLYDIRYPATEAIAQYQTLEEVIRDEARLLRHIPEVGSERGKAYDYASWGRFCPEVDDWDQLNVAGLKKRVSLLLGFDDYYRKTLSCPPDYYVEVVEEGMDSYRFFLREKADGPVLLESVETYRQRANATAACEELAEVAMDEDHYQIGADEEQPELQRLYLLSKRDRKLAQSPQAFPSDSPKPEQLKAAIWRLANSEDCETEGFHLVEHILLRPREDDYELLPTDYWKNFPGATIEVSEEDESEDSPPSGEINCLGQKDPYSFWATVLIPNWLERFEDENRKFLFEQTLRREAPAHVALNICWLTRKEMLRFEMAYLEWLAALAKTTFEWTEEPRTHILEEPNNELVRVLSSLVCPCRGKKPGRAKCREQEDTG